MRVLKTFCCLMTFNMVSLIILVILKTVMLPKDRIDYTFQDEQMDQMFDQIRQLSTYPIYQTILLLVLKWLLLLKKVQIQIQATNEERNPSVIEIVNKLNKIKRNENLMLFFLFLSKFVYVICSFVMNMILVQLQLEEE